MSDPDCTDARCQPAVPRWHIHRRLYDWVLHWADTRYGTPALGTLAVAEACFLPIPVDPLLIALALGKPRRSFYYSLICSAASVLGGVLGYLIGFALWNPVGAPVLRHLGQLTHEHQVATVVEVDRRKGKVVVEVDGARRTVDRLHLHPAAPVPEAPVGDRDYELHQGEEELLVGQRAYVMTDNYHSARALYERYGVWIVFIAAFTPVPYNVTAIISGLAQLNIVAFVATSVVGRSARFFLVGGLIFIFGEPIRRFIERYFNLLTLVFVVLLIGVLGVVKLLY